MSKFNNLKNYLNSFKGLKLLKVIEECQWEGIYYCYHAPVDKYVQIEIIDIKEVPDTKRIYIFKKRIENLRALKHPHVVELLNSKISEEFGYIMMDATETIRLRDVIDKYGSTSPKQALTITKDIALALELCHAQKHFHGEVRPSNIFISSTGEVQVRNFFLFEKNQDYILNLLKRRAEYVSPEMISFENISFQTDIYSLGIILYEMLTGKPPFMSDVIDDVWKMHLSADFDLISSSMPDLGVLDAILKKALHKAPHSRYDSMNAFIMEINQVLLQIPEELSFNRYIENAKPKKTKGNKVLKSSVRGAGSENDLPTSAVPPKKVNKKKSALLSISISAASFLCIGVFCYFMWSQYQKSNGIEEEVASKPSKPTAEEIRLAEEKEKSRYRKTYTGPKKTNKKTIQKDRKEKEEPAKETPQIDNNESDERNPEYDSIKEDIKELKAAIKLPKDEAIAYLEKKLESPIPLIRLLANQILRDVRGNNLVEFSQVDDAEEKVNLATEIFTKINDDDPKVKLELLKKISSSVDMDTKEYLLVLAQDKTEEVAMKALAQLALDQNTDALPLLVDKFKQNPHDNQLTEMLFSFKEKSEEYIAPLLTSEEDVLRKRALQFSFYYNSEATVKTIAAMILQNKPDAFRAALCLAQGSASHNKELLRLVLESNEQAREIALLGLCELKEPQRKTMLSQASLTATGDIAEQIQIQLLQYKKDFSSIELSRKQFEFCLSDLKINDRKMFCKLLSKHIGVFEEEMDARIYKMLTDMQNDAIPALYQLYASNENAALRKKLISTLGSIKSSVSAAALLKILSESKGVQKQIMDALIALDPISTKAIASSEVSLEKKTILFSKMPSIYALTELIALLDKNDKRLFDVAYKTHTTPEEFLKKIFIKSSNDRLLEHAISKSKSKALVPHFPLLIELLAKDKDSLREKCFDILKEHPAYIQSSLYEMMQKTKHEDIIFNCIDIVEADNPNLLQILALGFDSKDVKTRSNALKKYIEFSLPVSDHLLDLYSREKDRKINKNIIKFFNKPANNQNINFHLINCGSKSSSLKKASLVFLNKLDFNKSNSNALGQSFAKPYSLSIKKVVLKIFYNKDPTSLVGHLCNALPTNNEEDSDFMRKSIKGFGKKAGPALVARMNASTDAVKEIKHILEEMKLTVSYSIERKKFVLD